MEKKYTFALKGAIWWEKTIHQPFDLSHVVFINREIEANDAREAIGVAEKIVKNLCKENPSKKHEDYGVKAELFLGEQSVWEHRFAKGNASKEYWEKRKALDPKFPGFYEVALRVFTEPPERPQPIFRRTGVLHRHPAFSRDPVKGDAG